MKEEKTCMTCDHSPMCLMKRGLNQLIWDNPNSYILDKGKNPHGDNMEHKKLTEDLWAAFCAMCSYYKPSEFYAAKAPEPKEETSGEML